VIRRRTHSQSRKSIPRNTLIYVFRVAILFPLSLLTAKYLVDYDYDQLHAVVDTLNKIFPNPFFNYISIHVIEIQMVSTKMWSSFAGPLIIISVVSATSIILLRAIAQGSPEAQEKLSDKALFWGLVAFAYSRALSMMG
jgi:amino acid permease